MEQLNYPIKYAILEIEEQVGWYPGLHELEREYDVCGYIVSKAYVVGETIKYNGDGTYKMNYQVVFPFASIAESKKEIPRYNIYYQCYNSINVSNIFENFDEAKQFANEKNRELRAKSYLPKSFNREMSLTERVLKGQSEFDERMKKYLEFENFVVKETADMEITPDDKMKNRVRKL